MKTLSDAALDVLASSLDIRGNEVRITRRLTDRKLYQEVNAALEAVGGKWNRKAQAHVFERSPAEALATIVDRGEFRQEKQELGQFFTPPELAKRMVSLAQIDPGDRVLEPSCGSGNLVVEILRTGGNQVCFWEISAEVLHKCTARVDALIRAEGRTWGRPFSPCPVHGDFLLARPETEGAFDAVVMNPPFAKGADVAHVTHALRFLKPGGRLVAVMSAGVAFRQDKKTAAFRALAEERGSIEALPEGTFRESGTSVNTVLVEMVAPANLARIA